jgi:hypothetical protein
MAARRTRAPFISLWARDDVRTAIVDFLPTKTIAVLPCVVKPLRAAQSQLLVTAIRRRGKTAVPSPPTTRALLDALLVGEPQQFCEKWERGLEQWEDHAPDKYTVHISRPPEGGRYLNLIRVDSEDHSGFARRIRSENLLVTRLQVTMSYVECAPAGAVGYVMFCNPGDQRWDVAMGGPRFDSDYVGGEDSDADDDGARVSLVWMGDAEKLYIVRDVLPNTSYTIDARIRHESVTSDMGRVDVSVNGHEVLQGVRFCYRPLSCIHLYNYCVGTSTIGRIDIRYEKAAPNQVWAGEHHGIGYDFPPPMTFF